jgi:sugar phosphate isomerase/epimerase
MIAEATMYSRRQFSKIAMAGMVSYPALAAKDPTPVARIKSEVGGIQIGLHSYSLRSVPHDKALDAVVSAMQEVGLGRCELFAAQVEPASQGLRGGRGPGDTRAPLTPEQQAAQKAAAEALTEWRLTAPLDYFEGIRRKFNDAGIDIFSYNARFGETNEEIDRIFAMTKALGAETVTARIPLPVTTRIGAFANTHKMKVGIQSTDADTLMQQLPVSDYFGIDLDIGDFTKAGHDALQFVHDHYARLTDIHLKDCVSNGASVPFGQGDSRMKEVLEFLRGKKTSIPMFIDCDYPGTGDSVDEIKKCYAYVRAALA